MARQIQNIFDQIEDFERGAGSFQEKNFVRGFQGGMEYFQLVGDDVERVKMVDQSLLGFAQSTHPEKSTLRYLTIHTLTTIFDYVVGAKTKSEAYVYCRRLRKNQKDSAFFARELIPRLFEPEGLKGNQTIRYLFMFETCMLQEVSGDQNPLRDDLPLSEARRIKPDQLVLALFRRMLKAGKPPLVSRKGTVEYKLAKAGFFSELAHLNPVYRRLLQEWGYVEREAGFWDWFVSFFGRRMRTLLGTLGSLRFSVHLLTQRSGAYLLYGVLILGFLFFAFYLPMRWMSYRDYRMEEFGKSAKQIEPFYDGPRR